MSGHYENLQPRFDVWVPPLCTQKHRSLPSMIFRRRRSHAQGCKVEAKRAAFLVPRKSPLVIKLQRKDDVNSGLWLSRVRQK